MHKMSTEWNQQLKSVLSKVIECLEKSNTWINIKHLETNWLQKTIEYEAFKQVQNIQIKAWKYKSVECWEIGIRLVLPTFASDCLH